MADNNINRWYLIKEQLANMPSIKCGYDKNKELYTRQTAAHFIQDMGIQLKFTQLCINTAIVYMHRFYVIHSFTQFPWNSIATACIFLASKVENQPRKAKHVVHVHNFLMHRKTVLNSEQISKLIDDLFLHENLLLVTFGFQVSIEHPHSHVIKCCELIGASKDLSKTAYFMATNSLHLTTMFLEYKPTLVACFCIYLSLKWSGWEIPISREGKPWYWYVDKSITFEQLERLLQEFLVIYDKFPTKLKRKIQGFNPSVK
jgi:cyclin T